MKKGLEACDRLEAAEHKAMLNQVDHNYLEQLTNDYEQLQANLEATEDEKLCYFKQVCEAMEEINRLKSQIDKQKDAEENLYLLAYYEEQNTRLILQEKGLLERTEEAEKEVKAREADWLHYKQHYNRAKEHFQGYAEVLTETLELSKTEQACLSAFAGKETIRRKINQLQAKLAEAKKKEGGGNDIDIDEPESQGPATKPVNEYRLKVAELLKKCSSDFNMGGKMREENRQLIWQYLDEACDRLEALKKENVLITLTNKDQHKSYGDNLKY